MNKQIPVDVYSTMNFYGRTVWRVWVGAHFLGTYTTKEEAVAVASRVGKR